MKKCLSAVVAICLVVLLAVPAMALDTKFSGQYRVRGFHNSNFGLNDNDASDSYFDMRFRLQTDFMVSDHLTLTTRFDALDNKRFGDSDLGGRDRDNIDFDRAFMTIRTDMGTFMGGRMSGGTWGTLFNDTEGERDRLRWHDSFGDLTIYAIYEKIAEGDAGRLVSDQDYDIYYLGAAYKMENIAAGLLYGYVNNNSVSTQSDKFHLFIPYVIGQFGPFGIQGELRYNGFGERDNDFEPDEDIEQLAANLEATFSMDMFKFELGGVYVRGQRETDSKIRGYGGAIGDDWQKVWILTNSEDTNVSDDLGGVGNLSTAGGLLDPYGAQIYYGGLTVMPMEKLDVKFLAAYARADKTPSGVDKNFGMEYDLFLNYKIFDNLTYSFIAAYLDAGAFWRDVEGGPDRGDLNDNFHLFNQLSLRF
jgi:hypothetical protein